MNLEALRGSGRTTRMLKEALRLNSKGYAVYVVGATAAHARDLERSLFNLNPSEGHGIKFESAESQLEFDWRLMRRPGSAPNARFLVDHWAIEYRYADMLEMLHRFDSKE